MTTHEDSYEAPAIIDIDDEQEFAVSPGASIGSKIKYA